MSTMITEVYEALKEAGVSDSKAIKAAESIQPLSKEDHIHFFKSTCSNISFTRRGEFKLLKWMIGFNLAFTMAILWKVFA